MQKALKRTLIPLLTLLLILMAPMRTVQAQAGTAADLISGVNSLRQSQGLEPYTTDSYLMSFAQTHSNYMASLGTWTHTRADGSTAFDYGIKENVAMGTNMSIGYCIYTVWSDYTHWVTMVGYNGGKVGAGVAIADNTVYYTLNVIPSGSTVSDNPEASVDIGDDTNVVAQETEVWIYPVTTVTPNADGIIIHTVKYGETLWDISQAYGVPIETILTNSHISLETTAVYEGQTLIIQKATVPTATATPTPTEDPGTPTPTQPRATMTPYPTRTPSPTQTPTRGPSIISQALGNGKGFGIGLVAICVAGLGALLYFGFLKKS